MVTSACSALVPRRERVQQLHAAAATLVPEGADVIGREQADCVEFAASPSCVFLYFVRRGRLNRDERVREVEAAANTAGWRRTSRREADGGTSLTFEREGFFARATVWAGERARRCREAEPTLECADRVQVERR